MISDKRKLREQERDNNRMASSKNDAKWKGEKTMLVSLQRKSDVLGVAYFVQREGSMPILCRGRRGEFTGGKK